MRNKNSTQDGGGVKTKHVKNNKQEDEFVDIINVNHSELYFEIVISP